MNQQQAIAWLVHLYTASGAILGMSALFLVAQGEIREAFLILLITVLIDSTDGMLARRVRVREVLPQFDGAMMDNVIDVFTYIWIPVFIIGQLNLLPHNLWLVLPIMAGMYAYGQADMKSDDHYFIGFPSYWNVVALYLFWLRPDPIITVIVLAIPTILTFIPTRYLYPSRNPIFARSTGLLASIWLLICIYMLSQPHPPLSLIWLSLLFPAWYMILSFYVDWRVRTNTLRVRH